MRNLRQIISFILAAVMVCSLLPVTAAAEDFDALQSSMSGVVKVKGRISSSDTESYVTMVLKSKADENLGYINQCKPDKDGNYSFVFPFKGNAADYELLVNQNGTVINDTVRTSSFYSELVEVDVDVDWFSDKLILTGNIDNSMLLKGKYYVLLASYDSDNNLVNVTQSELTNLEDGKFEIEQLEIPNKGSHFKAFVWYEDMIPLCKAETDRSMKVLVIGSSFGIDGIFWLGHIADAYGIEDVEMGYLYKGSASLQHHWDIASSGTDGYERYSRYSPDSDNFSKWETVSEPANTLQALTDEEWDIIVLMHSGGVYGDTETYEPELTNLINYVNEHKLNPNAKLAWHMTWAYQTGCDRDSFVNDYGGDQMKMYDDYVAATNEVIVPNTNFDFIIPVGTAIQNARTSKLGDTLNKEDGYHLSYFLGRYIAAMTWFKSLTGLSIDEIDYIPPESEITDDMLDIVKEAVNNAYETPLAVTQSKYIE